MGKIYGGIIALCVATLLLAGCTTSTGYDTNPLPGEQEFEASVPESGSSPDEEGYLTFIKRAHPMMYAEAEDDRELLAMGYASCKLLDQGWPPQEVIEETIARKGEGEVANRLTVTLIGAALLCPEYRGIIEDFAEGLN